MAHLTLKSSKLGYTLTIRSVTAGKMPVSLVEGAFVGTVEGLIAALDAKVRTTVEGIEEFLRETLTLRGVRSAQDGQDNRIFYCEGTVKYESVRFQFHWNTSRVRDS